MSRNDLLPHTKIDQNELDRTDLTIRLYNQLQPQV